MISFIIPWFKKLEWWRMTLPHNSDVFSNDAEVVLALDEPSEEKAVLEMVRQWPSILFTVIVNDVDHPWRPPCKAINVAVRHAVGDRLVVMSPETVLVMPKDYLQRFHNCRLGLLWNIELKGERLHQRLANYRTTWAPANFGYGFIQMPTWAFWAIGGYDEAREGVSGDDNDIRLRLMRFGMQFTVDPNIHAVHIWHDNPLRTSVYQPPRVAPIIGDQRDLGTSFRRMAWSWRMKT